MASSSRKISDFRTLKKAVKKVNEDKRKQEEACKRAERQAISDRELFLKIPAARWSLRP